MRMRIPVAGLSVAGCLVVAATLGSTGAAATQQTPTVDPPRASSSLSLAGPIDRDLEQLQRRIVRDRDRATRGWLRLGALSDGHFEIMINQARHRIEVVMPPLRAKRLKQTQRLVAKRYGNAPVVVQLARFIPAKRLRDPDTAPRPGEPFICRGETVAVGLPGRAAGSQAKHTRPLPADSWNAKQIVGMSLPRARRMAIRRGCEVREVWVDGMALSTTMDYRSNRMNVAVRGGRVARILRLG